MPQFRLKKQITDPIVWYFAADRHLQERHDKSKLAFVPDKVCHTDEHVHAEEDNPDQQ